MSVPYLCASVIFISSAAWGQDKQYDFSKGRIEDFTKLIGGLQEGPRVNYNTDKTNVEYSGNWKIRTSTLLQTTGAIGTTTNLGETFANGAMPTGQVSVTLHRLLGNMSIWYFDGQLRKNQSFLQSDLPLKSIDTGTKKFTYRQALRDKIHKGTLVPGINKLYTARSFFWVSGGLKYDYSKYTFFDDKAAFDKQFSTPRFTTWSARLFASYMFSWNHTDVKWAWWKPRFYYVTFGLQRGLDNNVSQLKKKTVTDIKSVYFDASTNTTRQVTETTSAYTSVYRSFACWTPQFEIIYSPVQYVAVDLFGNYNLIDSQDRETYNLSNYLTLAAGLYFYGNGEKSKINIGLYYKWVENPKEDNWVGTFNLKTSIPIVPL